MPKRMDAEKAIRQIAIAEGVSVEEIRREMEMAMLSGLCDPDPAVQARWKQVPCAGDVPTPEELISYLASHIDAGLDPFA